MKILITGASGLLGKYLLQILPPGYEVIATCHKNMTGLLEKPNWAINWRQLDVREWWSVFEIFEIFKPEITIHCAAIGSVDYAEKNYQEVKLVNYTGTKNVMDAANGYKSKLVYISTNAVYAGDKPPYDEESILSPVNNYGTIKAIAERLIKDQAKNWLIIRPFMLYGFPYPGGRTNWVIHIIETLLQDKIVNVVNDIVWQPTYAYDCADAIWKLLETDNTIYNVAAHDSVTLYEFALEVARIFELDESLINPVDSNFFTSLVKRPRNSSYDLSKINSLGIELDNIGNGLKRMKDEMEDKYKKDTK